MKYYLLGTILLFGTSKMQAQEFFLFSYPASNVPKNTLVVRGMNAVFKYNEGESYSYHLMPALEYGLSKNLMLVANTFINKANNKLSVAGGSIFGQYRFYKQDAAKKHFRMAVWSRIAINKGKIQQEEIELNRHNTGLRLGLTATQLLQKTALSSTISFQKALNNIGNSFPKNYSTRSVDYTFSFGRLVFPKQYTNLQQTNVNLMIEFLGQSHLNSGNAFLDVAPAIQFIFKSKMRLDLYYRQQLYSAVYRTHPNGVILNFQYSIFNLIKANKP